MSEQLKAVVTDIDGVVVESEDYHRRAYNTLFAELGLELRYSGADYAARLEKVGGAKIQEVMDLLEVPIGERDERKRELYRRKTALFSELILADLSSGALGARPGIVRLFSELAEAGLTLSAASTCVKSAALEILRLALGESLFSYLTAVCAGDDVANKKPAPDIYLRAAEQSGVQPSRCLAIEDSVHGLQAARSAGMKCLVTPSEYTLNDDFPEADHVVVSLDEPIVTLDDLRALAER